MTTREDDVSSEQDGKTEGTAADRDKALQENHLDGLALRMEEAMGLRRDGQDDQASDVLRAILQEDPRLRRLIHEIVDSDAFRFRAGMEGEER